MNSQIYKTRCARNLAIISGTVLLSSLILSFYIQRIITFFILPIYFFVLFALLCVSFVFSVHLLYKWDGKAGFPALLPLIINIAAVALLIVLPFRKISNRLDYSLFLSSRLEVIEKIESGELMPDGNGVVWLPAKYAAVSDGGAVDLVSWYDGKVCFCFYTFAGMLDSYCGFAYLAETSVAESDSFLEIQLGDSYGGGWHVFSGG